MTYLVVYIPKDKAGGKSIDDLFPEDVINKIPTKKEIELIEEEEGYNLVANFDTFSLPDRKELRVALADDVKSALAFDHLTIFVAALHGEER